jgi:UDPglucose 6-dehydrogenase
MEATEAINADHGRRLAELVLRHHAARGGSVAVLGLAFRHDTPVTTMSPSLALVKDLLKAGVDVIGCDPVAEAAVREELGDAIRYAAAPGEALAAAAVAVITHRSASFKAAVESVRPPAPLAVIDCWRTIDARRVAPSVSVIPFGRFTPGA